MTASTINRQAEEGHTQILGHLERIIVQDKEVGRAVIMRISRRRDQLSDHLIPRHVGRDSITDPAIIRPEPLSAESLAVEQQNVAPFVRPVVNVLRTPEELIDETISLIAGVVSEKEAHVFGRRQNSNRVNEDSPQKLCVTRLRRRRQIQAPELLEDKFINKVAPRCFREVLFTDFGIKGHRDRCDDNPAQIPNGHGSLAMPENGDSSLVINFCHRGVRTGVLGPGGDILAVSIREMSANTQALLLPGLQHHLRRIHVNGLNTRIIIPRRRSPRRNPFRQHPVLQRIRVEAHSTLVRHCTGGLQKHQASRRIFRCHASSTGVASQSVKVTVGVVAAQGKRETVLTRDGSVAGSRITPRPGKNRLHMVAKAPLPRILGNRIFCKRNAAKNRTSDEKLCRRDSHAQNNSLISCTP